MILRFNCIRWLALIYVFWLLSPLANAAPFLNTPPPDGYLLQPLLGLSPTSVAEAQRTLPERRDSTLRWGACGGEFDQMIGWALGDKEPPEKNKAVLGAFAPEVMMAKIQWIREHAQEPCIVRVWVGETEINTEYKRPIVFPEDLTLLLTDREVDVSIKKLNFAFKNRFSINPNPTRTSPCESVNPVFKIIQGPIKGNGWTQLEITLSPACMIEQVRLGISERVQDIQRAPEIKGYVGTSDALPCFENLPDDLNPANWADLKSPIAMRGDYDMQLIDLVRLYNLDGAGGDQGLVLTPELRRSMLEKLFTVRGHLQPDDYSLTGCGNTDRQQGSAQDTVDEASFLDDIGDVLGDIKKWFEKFLWLFALFFVVAVVIGLLMAAGAFVASSVVTSVVVAGAAVVLSTPVILALISFRIPESENHLLMINSSKLLINQALEESLTNQSDKKEYEKWNQDIKKWLLHRLQRIAQEGFVEYNSASYSDVSLQSIMNLYDFSKDKNIRSAAAIVLEIEMAKYAASNSEARRIRPFRRKLNNIKDAWNKEYKENKTQLVHGLGGGDYAMIMMQYFTGMVNQLPKVTLREGEELLIRRGRKLIKKHWFVQRTDIVKDWIYPATSSYRPYNATLDWSLPPSPSPIMQRVHHDGIEIYSRAPTYTITAGGIMAKLSTPLITPVADTLRASVPGDIGETLARMSEIGTCNDLGAAVPTSVQLSAGSFSGVEQLQVDSVIQFEGNKYQMNAGVHLPIIFGDIGFGCTNTSFRSDRTVTASNANEYSHDDNTCVYKGFACGTNLKIPPTLDKCASALGAIQDGSTPDSKWWFLNSDQAKDHTDCNAFVPRPGKRFFLAAYRANCSQNGETVSRCDTWGVVEVVDAPQIQFIDFMRDVRLKNEAGLKVEIPADGKPFPRMSYTTAVNQKIEFEIEAHLGNQALWDIRSVDGNMQTEIGNWPYLDGDVISTISNGHHQIAKHGGFPSIDLDFTKELQPRIIEK